MNQAIAKELESKRPSGKKVPPVGIRSRDFWGKRASSSPAGPEHKAHFVVTCVNHHSYKTDVKPPRTCPVCHVVVDRRGYV